MLDMGVEQQHMPTILQTIQELVEQEEDHTESTSTSNALTLSVIMTGLNKKKDYTKPK